MAKTIAIKIDVQGTAEQQKKLAQLETEVKKLTNRRTQLNKAVKEGTISLAQYGKEIAEVNTRLKANRREMLVMRENILGMDSFTKKLGKSFSKLGTSISGAFVGLFAVQKLFQVMGDAIETIKEFEQQMANVKAITGATDEEFEKLEKSAKDLGKSTRRTALEVAQLQEEYAKLGFTTQEILDATEATVMLSEATGSDLAQSANVAASTLNGFRLEADETQRIVDVMAASFTSSALDLGKFEVAMRQVAPVAADAGLSIEQTTAFLGTLADNGIRAETAGTGLRNIFLTLAQTGLSFEEAMEGINSATNKSAAATELFGKENAVVATTIANNITKIDEQAEALYGAAGAAEEMAEITGDTLSGDIDRLSSAWDGFILSLDEGEGTLGKVLRGAVEFATSLLELFQEIDKLDEARKVNSKIIRQARVFEIEKIKEIEAATKSIAKSEEEAEKFRISALKGREETLQRIIQNEEDNLTRLEKSLEGQGELNEKQKIELEDQKTVLEVARKRLDFLIDFNKREEEKRTGVKEETALQKLLANIEQANEKKLNELAAIGVEAAQKELDRRKDQEKISKKNAKEEEKRIREEAKAKKKAIEDAQKNLEESIENTTKLEQEALVLSIKDKKEAELKKLEFARQTALAEVKATENAEKEKIAINAKFDAQRKKIESENKKESDEKEASDKLELREKQLEFAQETANLLSEISTARVERQKSLEIDSLKAQLQQGLITQEQFDKQREEIERKAFENQKKIDIATAIANGAIAITKTIAQLGGLGAITPFGAASLALVGAQTATQVGVIASQKFEDGGVLSGPSHANGGIPFTVNGVGGFEAEGGEAIINKKSTAMFKPLLSAINQAGGGVSFAQPNISTGFFRDGGIASASSVDITGLRNEITQAVTESIKAIPVINNATDTISEAVKVSNIQSDATFG